jgi:hypothetical protein
MIRGQQKVLRSACGKGWVKTKKPDCFSGFTARLKSCPDTMPKGLKPSEFSAISGTAEAEPFQNISFVRKL